MSILLRDSPLFQCQMVSYLVNFAADYPLTIFCSNVDGTIAAQQPHSKCLKTDANGTKFWDYLDFDCDGGYGTYAFTGTETQAVKGGTPNVPVVFIRYEIANISP
jgi:hypothetical protein